MSIYAWIKGFNKENSMPQSVVGTRYNIVYQVSSVMRWIQLECQQNRSLTDSVLKFYEFSGQMHYPRNPIVVIIVVKNYLIPWFISYLKVFSVSYFS